MIAATVLHMIAVAIPNVPRAYVDYARFPLLSGVHQDQTYGRDTIGNSYVAKVVLNDPLDMYTKARLEQTPLEKATWTREASAPYPPVALLTAAGLYAIGEVTGIGFYGMVALLAALFIALSLWYFLNTRWYLFPLLYLNFAYFGHRFVYVQDDSYLAMLVVVMIALVLARSRRPACRGPSGAGHPPAEADPAERTGSPRRSPRERAYCQIWVVPPRSMMSCSSRMPWVTGSR